MSMQRPRGGARKPFLFKRPAWFVGPSQWGDSKKEAEEPGKHTDWRVESGSAKRKLQHNC